MSEYWLLAMVGTHALVLKCEKVTTPECRLLVVVQFKLPGMAPRRTILTLPDIFRIRLRRKTGKNPGNVYLNKQTYDDTITMMTTWDIYMEILEGIQHCFYKLLSLSICSPSLHVSINYRFQFKACANHLIFSIAQNCC